MKTYSKFVVGIDPGKSGGLCVIECAAPHRVVTAEKMLDDESHLVQWLMAHNTEQCAAVVVEKIPKFAGRALPAAYLSTLFGNWQFIRGVTLGLSQSKLVDLSPLRWMNVIVAPDKRDRERATRKKQLLEVCRKQWPESKWSLATCDAALIALAAIRLGLV